MSSDSHSRERYADPAATKLINNIKKSMIAVSNEVARHSMARGEGAALEEKMIRESVQAYLSKAD